jgi:hypothetical protein
MTIKLPYPAIPAGPDGNFNGWLGGWISGACLPQDDGPARELAALRADFPQFEIWPEATLGRLRYVSLSTRLDLHPHTVVTGDLGELRTVLQSAQPLPAPTVPRPRIAENPKYR